MRTLFISVCGLIALYACSEDKQPSDNSGVPTSGTSPIAGTDSFSSGIGASGESALGTGGSATIASNAGNSSSVTNTAGTGSTTNPNNTGAGGSSAPAGNAGVGGTKNPDQAGISAAGVSGSEAAGTNNVDGPISTEPRLAVTADFMNQSLTIIDLNKLQPGATRDDIVVGTVDFSEYLPGPLDLAITPDGKTAVVTVSAGWLNYFVAGGVPAGIDKVVFVDLEQKIVTGDLDTGSGPMGVVITPDGKRAFIGHFGESYFAVVDIENRTYERVPTGSTYNEELDIDDTGTTAVLSYGPAGDCVTFSVADPNGVKGVTVGTIGLDAGGVAFFPGTKIAYVVQAPTTLTGNTGGHALIDANNPQAPIIKDIVRVPASPTIYPVTAIPSRQTIAFPSTNTQTQKLSLVEMQLEGDRATEAQTIEVADADNLAYGASFDPVGEVVLLAVPGNNFIASVDLDTKESVTVPMGFSKSGPTTIRVVP